jgi:hypothetical protein
VIWRLAVCLALIPAVAAMVAVFPSFLKVELTPLWLKGPKQDFVAFFAGAGLYVLLHIFLHRPITVYVFGHELTHAIWARICGKKVKRIEVNKESGRTITEGSNWLVRLAPYCFPLYALVWIALWGGMQLLAPSLEKYTAILFFGIGFTYAFHVLLTLHFLKVGQGDLHAEGYVFSLTLILAVNFQLAAGVYAAISHRASWLKYQEMVWECLRSWGLKLLQALGWA